MQRYTKLKVWERSHQMVLAVYRASSEFPADERFGLTSQLRRAAVSVPTNIAEGAKRVHRAEYARFLNIAEGSLAETDYLLLLGRDLGYLKNTAKLQDELNEIAAMLSSLRTKVETRA